MIFGQNPWTNPFGKYPLYGPFLNFNLFLLKIILFFLQYQKRCFLIWFLWKTPIKKSSILRQNLWTNPFKKMSMFWPSLKLQFFVLTMFVFYPKKTKNHFSWHDLCTKHPYEKFRFLDKIHGLTPLETVHFLALFLNSYFFNLKSFFSFINIEKKSFVT